MTAGQFLEPAEEVAAALAHTGKEALGEHDPQHLDRGRGRHRVAAEGGGVTADSQRGRDRFRGQHGAHGQAVGQRLGHGHDVRGHAQLFVGEQGAGAAHAGLHLVEDEQQAVAIAECADRPQVVRVQRPDAAFALQRLTEHGAGLGPDQPFDGRRVTELGMHKALRQRLETLVKLGLAGGGDRGQGAAVEGAEERDHFVATRAAVNAGQLDGRLVGLGAGVAHEHPVGEAVGHEHLGQLDLRPGVEQVGHMHQGLRLATDGRTHLRVAVAERTDGDTGEKIEILAAVRVPQPAAATAHHGRRKPVVGADENLVTPVRPICVAHATSSVPIPARVKISSRIACSCRPSMICALATPPSSADLQQLTLGIMPP